MTPPTNAAGAASNNSHNNPTKKHSRSRGRQPQSGPNNRQFHNTAKKPTNDGNHHKKKARTAGRVGNSAATAAADLRTSKTNGPSISWREDDNDDATSSNRIHPGSYAHETQRQRFNVVLPSGHATAGVAVAATTVKRKVAMLLGYRGTDYGGFQINDGQRTIQGDVELALYQAGLIRPENFGIPHKYGWSTSGRTDKGVHAAAQTVSCKVELPVVSSAAAAANDVEGMVEMLDHVVVVVEPEMTKSVVLGDNNPVTAVAATKGGESGRRDETDHGTRKGAKGRDEEPPVVVSDGTLELVRQRINSVLPPAITVMSIIRTTRGFCAKTQRDKVRYQYLLPSFMIDPLARVILDSVVPTNALVDVDATTTTQTPSPALPPRDTKNPLLPHELAALQAHAKTVRSTQAQRDDLQSVLQQYIGTHRFHNFTKGVSSKDARANRYIIAFDVHEPVVDAASQTEWIPTTVTGQAFLIHQIRKMIGAAMEIVRHKVPYDYIQTALTSSSLVPVPIAPATGLFLEQSWYDGYNRRKNQSANSNNANMVDVPDLDWSRPGPVLERWQACVASLQKHIIQEEQEQGNFWQYLFVQERVFPALHFRHDDFVDPAPSTADLVVVVPTSTQNKEEYRL